MVKLQMIEKEKGNPRPPARWIQQSAGCGRKERGLPVNDPGTMIMAGSSRWLRLPLIGCSEHSVLDLSLWPQVVKFCRERRGGEPLGNRRALPGRRCGPCAQGNGFARREHIEPVLARHV